MYYLTDIDLEEVVVSLMMVFTLCETRWSNSNINSIFFVLLSIWSTFNTLHMEVSVCLQQRSFTFK